MNSLIYKFSLDAVKFNNQILVCVILIWLATLACTISSVFDQPFTPRQRTFWMTLLIAFPIIGLLAYLPFSFKREELPLVFRSRNQAKNKNRHTHHKSRPA